ncbi:MAG TPA: bifunctional precorrin-2 dehydrogenase/sirohydrochlorin ferrochelatase [Ilumatobacteraceae bacterium]|nr:bifunctional precorrin-2 dehydrogenase/sirohydrochlorin ferrochelatase [Ilumatobacteraceae bacterium]
MPFDYPIVLDLAGVPVLVVGGGKVARRKIGGLVAARADITVVAPTIDDAIRALPVRIVTRAYEPTDLDGVWLVVTATDDPSTNAAVAADAQARLIWVNSADDPANCTFTLPAIARDGAVTVAISTGGASPALAAHLRAEIEQWLADIGAADAAATLAAQRDELRSRGVSTESVDWSERVRHALRPPA